MTTGATKVRTTLELDDPKTGIWMLVTDEKHIAEYLAERPPPAGDIVTEWQTTEGLVRERMAISTAIERGLACSDAGRAALEEGEKS